MFVKFCTADVFQTLAEKGGGGVNSVDLWTVEYHQGAHTPSSGLGPAFHLAYLQLIQ